MKSNKTKLLQAASIQATLTGGKLECLGIDNRAGALLSMVWGRSWAVWGGSFPPREIDKGKKEKPRRNKVEQVIR